MGPRPHAERRDGPLVRRALAGQRVHHHAAGPGGRAAVVSLSGETRNERWQTLQKPAHVPPREAHRERPRALGPRPHAERGDGPLVRRALAGQRVHHHAAGPGGRAAVVSLSGETRNERWQTLQKPAHVPPREAHRERPRALGPRPHAERGDGPLVRRALAGQRVHHHAAGPGGRAAVVSRTYLLAWNSLNSVNQSTNNFANGDSQDLTVSDLGIGLGFG